MSIVTIITTIITGAELAVKVGEVRTRCVHRARSTLNDVAPTRTTGREEAHSRAPQATHGQVPLGAVHNQERDAVRPPASGDLL